jgi:hypothetical protein
MQTTVSQDLFSPLSPKGTPLAVTATLLAAVFLF